MLPTPPYIGLEGNLFFDSSAANKSANYSFTGGQNSNYAELEHKKSRAIKGAPLDSLFSQFCLHAMWFGNCNIRGLCSLGFCFFLNIGSHLL